MTRQSSSLSRNFTGKTGIDPAPAQSKSRHTSSKPSESTVAGLVLPCTSPDAFEAANAPSLPVWIRLPKSGTTEFYTGLTRSALNALILPTEDNGFRPPVKSIVMKSNRHATRGIRLILLASLLEYLASQADTDTSAS